MGHSDGMGWLLGQPAAIISEYICGNFAQRVPEFVKKKKYIYIYIYTHTYIYTPGDLGSDLESR